MEKNTKPNRQWLLNKRPEGRIQDGDFKWLVSHIDPPGEGQVQVRNAILSLDPTNRIWASDMEQYLPPVEIGSVMRGFGLGVVEQSNVEDYQPGDWVIGALGWQDRANIAAGELNKVASNLPVPPEMWLSILGFTGMTAYFGLLDVGKPKAGETLVVSAAAGAVGSVVGQIGKLKGCRVIGIAGSDEKCQWLTDELGFDGAINYKSENVPEALDRLCPDGIDINFENVGGEILDAILKRLNLKARVVLCGLISQYNATEPVPGPYNFASVLTKRARVEGFIILDYFPRFPEGVKEMAEWVAAGKIKNRVHWIKGLENAALGVNQLFDGINIGKLLVKVSDLNSEG